jgi:hypothetical protein
LTDFVCLYTYEFWLSLNVILLFNDVLMETSILSAISAYHITTNVVSLNPIQARCTRYNTM